MKCLSSSYKSFSECCIQIFSSEPPSVDIMVATIYCTVCRGILGNISYTLLVVRDPSKGGEDTEDTKDTENAEDTKDTEDTHDTMILMILRGTENAV